MYKKTIFFVFAAVISISSTFSQYNWTDVQYHYQTGSVPPKYWYEYDIFINTSGKGSLVFHISYADDSTNRNAVYELNLTRTQVSDINTEIENSNVLTQKMEEMERPPIGGSRQNMRISLPQDPRIDHMPSAIETPYFPKSEDIKTALEKLYDVIRSEVPQSVWDDIEIRKK